MGLSIHNITNLFKNLTRQESTPSQKDYWKQILRYGETDNFPLKLARLVQNSPTAASCIDTKTDFIEGSGFSDPNLAGLKINNQGETFGDIHAKNSDAFGMFEGFVLNVKYNIEGKISEFVNIPFEYARLTPPDAKGVINKIRVNPYYGTVEYKETFTKEYDVYNPDPKIVLAQQAKETDPKTNICSYKGQILYVATTSPLSRFYPSPKYYSCADWMAIDEAIGGFHKNNIDNNFFQSAIIKMIGNENAPSTHPDDVKWDADGLSYEPDQKKTQGYRFNIEMQKFTGWEKAGNIMALWAENKDAMPEIQAFPSNTNAELFRTLQDMTTENIARGTKVPSILANIQSGASLGGDGNAIRASVKLMQQRVAKTQAMMERVYKELLSHLVSPYAGEVKILNYNPFPELEKIDPLIWAALPIESQRAWIVKNTEFEIPEAPPAIATPVNQFSNIFMTDYPEKARSNAQKALDFRNKTGSKCGTKPGWQMCEDIIASKPISFKSVKRIYNYLNKKREFENHIFTDSCESVLYSAWGGTDMLEWAATKIKSINE